MPSIAFIEYSVKFHHQIPRGVQVTVRANAPTFNITFRFENGAGVTLRENGFPVEQKSFLNVNSINPDVHVQHTFPLEAEGPIGQTDTTIEAVVESTDGTSDDYRPSTVRNA